MRLSLPAALLLTVAPLFAAEKEDKPVGRTLHERFSSPVDPKQQGLVFDTRQGAVGSGRSFEAGAARTKDFHFNQRFAPSPYQTGEFTQTKKSWFSNFNFFAKSANTKSKSEIPNANTAAPIKTATTTTAYDSGRKAAVRDLSDGDRTYLGPERKKLDQPVDPKSMANWREGGETVVNAGSSVEKYSNLKQLSVEDVREILNKNK